MKTKLLCLFFLCVMPVFTLGASATPDKNYLCFTANTANSTVELVKNGDAYDVIMQYSTDEGESWQTIDFAIQTTTWTIMLEKVNDKVYFRKADEGVASGFSKNLSDYYQFVMTGTIAANGNVMSLIDPTCAATTIPCDYCFCKLFSGCTSLTSAPELPATELTGHCYRYMFEDCTGLTSAPQLPATEMAERCYTSMFIRCAGLISAPELPATKLAANCYTSMFNGCTSLTSAPYLPAETLASGCYSSMFFGCTSLTSAPYLPAKTLVSGCYTTMFNGCTNLNNISVAFTSWASNTTAGWLNAVSSTGTFICPTDLSKTYGISNIPSGWTVVNSYDLTVSSVGWASMYLPFAVAIPEGVEVYYASAASGNTITLTQIETKIPANTGVIVKTAASKVTFHYDSSNPTLSGTNLFEGTSADKAFDSETDDAVYVLSGVSASGTPQFQNYTGTILGANKAYLPKSAVGSTGAINFVFDEATAINSMDVVTPKSAVRYNLNGQAVGSDYKGIVIVNGKKYINK